MKKFVCSICGYVYEGESLPADFVCPICKAPASKFNEMGGDMNWAAEHVVGIASDVPEEIKAGLRENFNGECSEVGMYLAMSRVAFREGYPEIGLYWEKAAFEEADHASRFAEMLGEVLTDSTKKNLEMRVDAEFGATEGKTWVFASTTRSTRWLATKPATAKRSRVSSRDTSAKRHAFHGNDVSIGNGR